MIRVAYVVRGMSRHGGIQRIVLSLIQGLDRERFQPYLIIFQRKQPEFDLSGIEVLSPQCAPGSKPWWAETRFACGVLREVRRRGIHILHSHDGANAHDRLALSLARLTGAKVLRTQHGSVLPRPCRLGTVARLTNRLTDIWTAVSPDIVDSMVRYGKASSGKLLVTPNGLNLARFGSPSVHRQRMRRSLEVPEGAILMLAVGSLVEWKDYPNLLEAFALANREVKNAVLFIAGEGPERTTLEQRICARDLDGRVRLLGLRSDVPQLVAAADLFVISSLGEGMPGAPMEAMAAGLPVIGTDVPGTRYVLDYGKAGVLVPPRSPERMAEAMVRLARDAALRREVAERGRRCAVENFCEEAMVRRYEEIYERMVGERSRPRLKRPSHESVLALTPE